MPQGQDRRRAEIALLTAGVLFGASTPVGRALGEWFAPATIVALRFAFALPFCFVGWAQHRQPLRTSAWQLVPLAVLFPVSCALFTYAFFETSIAVAIFGFYIANLLASLVVGVTRHGEPLDAPTIVAFVSSAVAVVLIALGQEETNGGTWLIGFLLACGAGTAATAIAAEQKRLASTVDGETMTLVQVAGGLLLCVAFAALLGDASVVNATWPSLALCLLYGLLFFACNRLMVYGFRRGAIGIGAILLSTEVLVGPLLALGLFGESVTKLELVGGAFIGVAVLMTSLRPASTEPPVEVRPGSL